MKRKKENRTCLIAGLMAVLLFFTAFIDSSFPAVAAGNTNAASITLLATQGTVTAKDRKGTTLSTKAGTRLLSGCTVTTAADSYAWLNLDDENALKLDADTEVLITKNKENLDVTVNKGSVFFDVSKKLPDTANYHIRDANMVMGIRGTIGYVQKVDDNHSVIGVLEGIVHVRVVDRLTGRVTEGDIAAGQIADTNDMASQNGAAQQGTGKQALIIRKITRQMIPMFIVAETATGNAADAARIRFGRGSRVLSGRIYDACGVDLRGVLPEDIPDQRMMRPQEEEQNPIKDALYKAWLAFDAQLKKEAQEEQERLIAAQPKAEEEVVEEVVPEEPKKEEEPSAPAVATYSLSISNWHAGDYFYTVSPGVSTATDIDMTLNIAAGTVVTLTSWRTIQGATTPAPGAIEAEDSSQNIIATGAMQGSNMVITFTMPNDNVSLYIK